MYNADADRKLADLWSAVDELLARASLPGILAHRLGPLAAARLRRLGEPLPRPLLLDERGAALCALVSRPLLERVRAACDGPLVSLKGPELAALYPGSARTFGDVDLLTRRARQVQQSLLTAGFVEHFDPWIVDAGDDAHHLMPLRLPTLDLKVEVHDSPNWPEFVPPPPIDAIFEASIPSSVGVAGVSAPAPVHHVLLVTAHAWRHEPFWRWRDLIDVAVLAAHADERELERTADAWGMHRLWRTTNRAIDGAFYGGRKIFPLRSWARHLDEVRERTSAESHVTRLVSGYWVMPAGRASTQLARGLYKIIAPLPGESWGDKARRIPRVVRNLRSPVVRVDARSRADRERQDAEP